MEKLIGQLDFDWNDKQSTGQADSLSEERGTLLFILDTINKHLVEFDGHPVRKVRETLDGFSKQLLSSENYEQTLFQLRQFLLSYRMAETSYFQKTYEDFRSIVWEFVDQLIDDLGQEQKDDHAIQANLNELRDAVESQSLEALKAQSRKFIEIYHEKLNKKDKRRSTRMKSIRKNLNLVKKQLVEANDTLRTDHLTKALNRKSFDEYCEQYSRLAQASQQPLSLMFLDIDHFKRINDTYGHPVGDFVLKELVVCLKSIFTRESDLVARIGGEEFAILLPDFHSENALVKAEEVLHKVRDQAYAHEGHEIRFTISIGVAQIQPAEVVSSWLKRTDQALYQSKNTGRNRVTLAPVSALKVA
jgi:diguanylate cyclase